MRGIECAVKVVSETGDKSFLSETLRKNIPLVEEKREQILAATLAYAVYRKLSLWRHLISRWSRRQWNTLGSETRNILLVGAAGVMELEHFGKGALINALVELTKKSSVPQDAAFINAVLGAIDREGRGLLQSFEKTGTMRDAALVCGVPGWVAAKWCDDYGTSDARSLLRMYSEPSMLAARLSSEIDAVEWTRANGGTPSGRSCVRFGANPFPNDLHGHADGDITPMSESSSWAVDVFLANVQDGAHVLDMCAGRGVKLGQVLSSSKGITAEAWDLSSRRLAVAQKEMERLGVSGRASFTPGDAAELVPVSPIDAVMLDAPCSGSGTWRRHPEGKWRLSVERVAEAAALQKKLLERAVSLVKPGGLVMYCTCSLFRDENERAVGSVMSRHPEMVELPVKIAPPDVTPRRGRPFGSLVYPEDPWIDGFYVAIFKRKG